MRLQLEAAADRLLLLLLLTDIALLLPFVAKLYDPVLPLGAPSDHSQLLLGYFLQLKLLWITGLLMELAIRRLSYLYLAWAAFFGFLLFDQSFHFNAQLGAVLFGDIAAVQFGLQSERLGQVLATVSTGALFVLILCIAHHFAGVAHRPLSMGLFGCLVALGAFGVIVDTVHAAMNGTVLWAPLGVLAATGEMLAVSGALWWVLRARLPVQTVASVPTGSASGPLSARSSVADRHIAL